MIYKSLASDTAVCLPVTSPTVAIPFPIGIRSIGTKLLSLTVFEIFAS